LLFLLVVSASGLLFLLVVSASGFSKDGIESSTESFELPPSDIILSAVITSNLPSVPILYCCDYIYFGLNLSGCCGITVLGRLKSKTLLTVGV
jgi:hypothetical protein